ncbi:MAG TPA: TolC family protein [Alloacidobacterium sp.]|jgi:cobalt-zinc-cadmium efflux system outer membrane protein|nr:TolC family protein [Alloacidobacterium sp.]
MHGRTILFPCALLFPALLLGAQQSASTPSTVDELVRTGIANNKDLAAVRERVAEAKGLARQARVLPSPVLDLSGSTGKPLGTIGEEQYGGGLSETVETFGKRSKRIRVAEYSIGIAEADLQQRSAELAYQIRSGYAEVSADRNKVKLLTDLIGVNQDSLRLTEARVKEGDIAPLEANLLKVEIARTEVSLKSAQGRLTTAELDLRRLVGLDESAPIPVSDLTPAPLPSLEALRQQALENRADLRSARLEEEQESAGIALAKAEAKPDVTLSAGYSKENVLFDDLFGFNSTGALSPIRTQENILTFGISVPLRTSRSGLGNVQAATAKASGARLRREYLERNISLEIEGAYQRWRTATDSVETLKSGVIDPSTTNLSVIREAYKLGQLRLLDVLNEQRRLVDTQMEYIDAESDVARTWAEVERAAGGNLP